MKKIILAIIIVAISSGIYLISKIKTNSDIIKIGALIPLSGIASNYGEGSREGIEIAKEELATKYPNININVVYEDSFYSPKGGVDGYKNLKTLITYRQF